MLTNPLTQEILGWIALIVSLIFTCIGLPSQIKRNKKRKSTRGLSETMMIMSFSTYLSWVFYSLSINDLYLFFANLVGAIFTAVILFQIKCYKK